MGCRGGWSGATQPLSSGVAPRAARYEEEGGARAGSEWVLASVVGGATKGRAGSLPRYDPRTALVVVDVQNDFAHPRGSLFVPGGDALVGRINEEVRAARREGATVVYTQDWHPPVTPHFERHGGAWPQHGVRGTWGAELHPDLEIAGEVVRKGEGGEEGYSGFTVRDPVSGETRPTRLEPLLRERGIRRVVVVGIATEYCVKETALDALRLGFEVEIPTDAVRAVDRRPGDGDRALDELRRAGARLT